MATDNTTTPAPAAAPVAPATPEAIASPVAPATANYTAKTKTEAIRTVVPNVPQQGSNMGRQMYIINGKHWSRTEPKATDTHVVLTSTLAKDSKEYWNVEGFSQETRMLTLDQKIKLLTDNDAAYAMAIASLLK